MRIKELSRVGTQAAMCMALVTAVCLCTSIDTTVTASDGLVTLAVPGRANATPWVATHGSFVAVAWGATPPGGTGDVFVAVSRDAGASFSAPVRVNAREGEARLGGEQPPRVALTAPASGGTPTIVVAWGAKSAVTEIQIAESRDAGRSFTPTHAVQAPGAPGDRGWHALALDATGAAHVIWLDHRGMATRTPGEHDHHAADGAAMAERSGLYYVRTGASPMAEREVTKGVCYCCKTALATGPGGLVYAAWRQVYPGNVRDIAFTLSRDDGRSFAAPVRVSADEWQLAGCPDDGPAMAVEANGVVHLVWPTVVQGATPEGGLFYASSRDGKTFTARQRIPTLGSPKPSHPQIAVGGDGRLVVAWDEVAGGVRHAMYEPVTVDRSGRATFGTAVDLGADATGVYPMLASTPRGLLAVWTRGAAGSTVIAVSRREAY